MLYVVCVLSVSLVGVLLFSFPNFLKESWIMDVMTVLEHSCQATRSQVSTPYHLDPWLEYPLVDATDIQRYAPWGRAGEASRSLGSHEWVSLGSCSQSCGVGCEGVLVILFIVRPNFYRSELPEDSETQRWSHPALQSHRYNSGFIHDNNRTFACSLYQFAEQWLHGSLVSHV